MVKKRIRWTESMINDLLYCKKVALAAIRSRYPPMKNGQFMGYIEYMHVLWLFLGYRYLKKTPDTLKSAAYNAEKKLGKSCKKMNYGEFNIYRNRKRCFLAGDCPKKNDELPKEPGDELPKEPGDELPKQPELSSAMLISSTSTSSCVTNPYAAKDDLEMKHEKFIVSSKMTKEDDSNKTQCYYYKVATYAASMAIFILLTLVFILFYSRCFSSFTKLSAHLSQSTKVCESCHEHAYCEVTKNESRCVCKNLFIGDGTTTCKDISFAASFTDDTKEFPTLTTSFQEVSDLSFCAWLSPSVTPARQMAVFSYISNDSTNKFTFWLTKDGAAMERSMQTVNISLPPFTDQTWYHMCCIWLSNGLVRFYLNVGKHIQAAPSGSPGTFMPGKTGHGIFTLGKSVQSKTSYRGLISQLYIYSRGLDKYERSELFRYQPPLNGVALSWDKLRSQNPLNCNKPEEIPFPF